MQNIEDCLFRASINISVEGDADIGRFETQMENSYELFITLLSAQLISSSPKTWSLRRNLEVEALDHDRSTVTDWLFTFFLKSLPRYKDKVRPERNGDSSIFKSEYPSWFLNDEFSDVELREAFAHAINDGLVKVSYKGISITNYGICISFELETLTSIYQYSWRSRWALSLVNFLSDFLKTSKRVLKKSGVITRLFRKTP